MRRTNFLVATKIVSKLLTVLMVLILTCGCINQSIPAHEVHAINGYWLLKSIYLTQNVQGPDPSQQKKLLGSTIEITTHSLRSCGQSVPVKSMKISKISSSDFLENTGARFQDIGVETQSIREVVINNRQSGTCFGAFPLPGQDVYIKNSDEIVIDFEGVFYRALRKR